MSFEFVLNRYPKAGNEVDWHCHKNGGGWVHNTTKIPFSCYVDKTSIIGHHCTIGISNIEMNCVIDNNCTIGDGCNLLYCEIGTQCSIGDGTKIGSGSKIGNRCVIGRGSTISRGCLLGNDCKLGIAAMIGAGCELSDGVNRSLHIRPDGGSPITACSDGFIQVGSRRGTFEWWEEHYPQLTKDLKCSDQFFADYWMHITYCHNWMKSIKGE